MGGDIVVWDRATLVRVRMDRRTARRYSLNRAMDAKKASGTARIRIKSKISGKLSTIESRGGSTPRSNSLVYPDITPSRKVQARSIGENINTPIRLSAQ